jgi:hypothetical protein
MLVQLEGVSIHNDECIIDPVPEDETLVGYAINTMNLLAEEYLSATAPSSFLDSWIQPSGME